MSVAFADSGAVPEGTFSLETDSHQQVTLAANNAFLNEILSQLGRQLEIEVVANLPDNPRITMEFRNQPLSEALKQMAGSYMLITDDVGGRVAGIFVLPKGDGSYDPTSPATKTENESSRATESSAFQFEFDPSAVPVEVEDEDVPAEEPAPD